MYTIIELILPIFVLIAFGKILRQANIISNEGIKTIKNLAVNLFLPFTFFNILIHGTFNKDSIILIIAGFIIIFSAYLLGFLFKPLFSDDIKKYVPYTNTCIESGMFALAILNMIIGKENLFQIIQMDMVNNIFVFTVSYNRLNSDIRQKANYKANNKLHNKKPNNNKPYIRYNRSIIKFG